MKLPILSQAQLIAYGVSAFLVLGLLGFAYWKINGWRTDAARVPELEARAEKAEATAHRAVARSLAAQDASEGYQNEIATLKAAAAARPVPVVRVCRELPGRTGGGALPAPRPRPDEGAAAAGALPPEPGLSIGPDVGPGLYGSADACDELAAQVRGLLDHVRRQARIGQAELPELSLAE